MSNRKVKPLPCQRVGVRCRIPRNADSFRQDLHPDLKADLVPVRKDLANPPFNMSDWGGENLRQDVRWKFGMPPVNNANYAWIQHFIHHLEEQFAESAKLEKAIRGNLKHLSHA